MVGRVGRSVGSRLPDVPFLPRSGRSVGRSVVQRTTSNPRRTTHSHDARRHPTPRHPTPRHAQTNFSDVYRRPVWTLGHPGPLLPVRPFSVPLSPSCPRPLPSRLVPSRLVPSRPVSSRLFSFRSVSSRSVSISSRFVFVSLAWRCPVSTRRGKEERGRAGQGRAGQGRAGKGREGVRSNSLVPTQHVAPVSVCFRDPSRLP